MKNLQHPPFVLPLLPFFFSLLLTLGAIPLHAQMYASAATYHRSEGRRYTEDTPPTRGWLASLNMRSFYATARQKLSPDTHDYWLTETHRIDESPSASEEAVAANAEQILALHEGILLAPNPTDGVVVAMMDLGDSFISLLSVHVYDIQGQELSWLYSIATGATRAISLDLSSEPKGVYIVRFDTQTAHAMKKVVVQ